MKLRKWGWLLAAGLLLGACSNEDKPPVTSSESVSQPSADDKQSQHEINEEFKESAEEITFDDAKSGDVEEGDHVKVTGQVSDPSALGEFTLVAEEDGEFSVTNLDTTDTDIQDGDQVTVYGTFGGEGDDGTMSLNATVIEKQ